MSDLINLKSPDLINLKSPETKSFQSSKLPSPLIPVPENIFVDDASKTKNLDSGQLHLGSRKSIDNNPFDMVIRKTSEYVNKAEDPFEIIWAKAMTSATAEKKDEFSDNYMITKSDVVNNLKVNETLKDSAFPSKLNSADSQKTHDRAPSIYIEPPSPVDNSSILSQSAMDDSLQIFSCKKNMFDLPSSSMNNQSKIDNLSILSQSAMNDSLCMSPHSFDGKKIRSLIATKMSTCMKQDTFAAETMDDKKLTNSKLHAVRRSFSQGDCLSPKKSRTSKLQTITGNELNDSLLNRNSLSSMMFLNDKMNQAFLPMMNEDSTLNASDISTIPRLDSVPSSLSSYSNNSTANRAFIDSDFENVQRLVSVNSVESIISDLVKLDHLEAKSSGGSEYLGLEHINRHITQEKNSKLVDISSDSVFLESDESCNNEIFIEAKNLEKHFEQLAFNSSGSSSRNISDETLPNQMPNELILEVDVPTDNLIELSPSPVKSSINQTVTENCVNTEPIKDDYNSNAQQKNDVINIKDLETKSLHPEKKLEAATLLMNLEQLVKCENNPKAIELLENLEKVLGITSQSNTELLKLCLQDTTNPFKGTKNHANESENFTVSKKKINVTVHIQGVDSSINSKQLNCKDNINSEGHNKYHESNILESQLTDKFQGSKINTDKLNLNNQKLVCDIKTALKKLHVGLNSEPVKLLETLNKILNSDDEDNQKKISPIMSMPMSPRNSGVPYRSVKSVSHQTIDLNMRKRSIERSFKHRSLVTKSMDTPKRSETKSRVDSPKRSLMKRISSDPGMTKVFVEKKLENAETALKMKKSLPVIDKTKLKKNCEEVSLLGRKGPLKAMIPLGSMQRSATINKKSTSLLVSISTPPKSGRKVPAALKLVTSTPDQNSSISIDCLKKSPKKKPVASSTPDAESKIWKAKIQIPQSPKNNRSWNISPVTPTPPKQLLNRSLSGSTKHLSKLPAASPHPRNTTPRRLDRTLSGLMIQSPSPLNSPLKKFGMNYRSRRSVPVQIPNKNEESKRNKDIPKSPLKDKNGSSKVKILSKVRRYSGNVDFQKENKLNC